MTDDTEVSKESENQQTDVKPEAAPGASLKAAREREGLSLDDIAKSLYITKNKLLALEDDDYQQFSSEVFIQGYLRKYAPIVGLDGEKLVSQYQSEFGSVQKPVEEIEERDDRLFASSNTFIPKFVVPAALFGIVGLVLIATFVFTGESDDSKNNLQSALPDVEVNDQQISQQISQQQDPEKFSSADALGAVQISDEQSLVEQAAAESAEINTDQPPASAQNTENAVDPIVLDEARNMAVISNSGSENEEATSAITSATLPFGLDQSGAELKFEFSEDCWIEVRDKIDAIIYTAVARAGQSLELQGEAPFSISLGNAEAVTLFWGDEQINTQPRPGYRTAKLVVGE